MDPAFAIATPNTEDKTSAAESAAWLTNPQAQAPAKPTACQQLTADLRRWQTAPEWTPQPEQEQA